MSKQVLIVDDFTSVRKLVDSVLSKQGFQTVQAEDGEEAVKKMKDHKFDLVVSDINMPNMDGVSLLEAVRAEQDTQNLPFLLVTTEGDIDLKKRAETANVSGWVKKPFKVDEFLSEVHRVI